MPFKVFNKEARVAGRKELGDIPSVYFIEGTPSYGVFLSASVIDRAGIMPGDMYQVSYDDKEFLIRLTPCPEAKDSQGLSYVKTAKAGGHKTKGGRERLQIRMQPVLKELGVDIEHTFSSRVKIGRDKSLTFSYKESSHD